MEVLSHRRMKGIIAWYMLEEHCEIEVDEAHHAGGVSCISTRMYLASKLVRVVSSRSLITYTRYYDQLVLFCP
jgi:hypothetical protein